MYQEEDGQFVAIDSWVMQYNTQEVEALLAVCQKRFIMLNDISVPINEEYVVNLRRSYILSGVYVDFICKQIFKNPSSSHYFMTGIRIVQQNNIYGDDGVRAIDLKINVGSANEWNIVDSQNDWLYGGAYAYFDSSDNVDWKMLITSTASTNSRPAGIYVWQGTNTTTQTPVLVHGVTTYRPYIDGAYLPNQVAFINENKAYYVMNNQRYGVTGYPDDKYIGL